MWRRSYDIPPPPMELEDPGHPIHDRRYAGTDRNALPGTESLATTPIACCRTGTTRSRRS